MKKKDKTKLCKHCKTEIPSDAKFALIARRSKAEY